MRQVGQAKRLTRVFGGHLCEVLQQFKVQPHMDTHWVPYLLHYKKKITFYI